MELQNGKLLSKESSRERSSIEESVGNESICPICSNAINDIAKIVNCKHQFCYDCIKEWSRKHNRCPVCKLKYSFLIINFTSDLNFFELRSAKEPLIKPSVEKQWDQSSINYQTTNNLLTWKKRNCIELIKRINDKINSLELGNEQREKLEESKNKLDQIVLQINYLILNHLTNYDGVIVIEENIDRIINDRNQWSNGIKLKLIEINDELVSLVNANDLRCNNFIIISSETIQIMDQLIEQLEKIFYSRDNLNESDKMNDEIKQFISKNFSLFDQQELEMIYAMNYKCFEKIFNFLSWQFIIKSFKIDKRLQDECENCISSNDYSADIINTIIDMDNANDNEESICPICLDPIIEIGKVVNCKHQFCYDCIKTWSQEHNCCPLCKSKFSYLMTKFSSDMKNFNLETIYQPQVEPNVEKQWYITMAHLRMTAILFVWKKRNSIEMIKKIYDKINRSQTENDERQKLIKTIEKLNEIVSQFNQTILAYLLTFNSDLITEENIDEITNYKIQWSDDNRLQLIKLNDELVTLVNENRLRCNNFIMISPETIQILNGWHQHLQQTINENDLHQIETEFKIFIRQNIDIDENLQDEYDICITSEDIFSDIIEALHLNDNKIDDEDDINTNVLREFDDDGFYQNRLGLLVHSFVHYQYCQLNNCH